MHAVGLPWTIVSTDVHSSSHSFRKQTNKVTDTAKHPIHAGIFTAGVDNDSKHEIVFISDVVLLLNLLSCSSWEHIDICSLAQVQSAVPQGDPWYGTVLMVLEC